MYTINIIYHRLHVTRRLSVNFASVIYCYGIKEGGLDEWNFAYEKLLNSNSGAERVSLMAALGCSRENWILHR